MMRRLFDAFCAVFCIGLATFLVGLCAFGAYAAWAVRDLRWVFLDGGICLVMVWTVWIPVVSYFGSYFRGVKYED